LVLGLAFNAMGRISKPQHGIPWTGQPDSVATLESYQAAPASPAPASADIPVVPDVPGPIELGLASLKKLWDAKAVLIVDARERDAYAQGHIAGAINVPYSEVADTLASASR